MITKTNVLAAHRETFGLPTLLSCVSSHELTRIQVKVALEKTCLLSLNLELFYCSFVCLSRPRSDCLDIHGRTNFLWTLLEILER